MFSLKPVITDLEPLYEFSDPVIDIGSDETAKAAETAKTNKADNSQQTNSEPMCDCSRSGSMENFFQSPSPAASREHVIQTDLDRFVAASAQTSKKTDQLLAAIATILKEIKKPESQVYGVDRSLNRNQTPNQTSSQTFNQSSSQTSTQRPNDMDVEDLSDLEKLYDSDDLESITCHQPSVKWSPPSSGAQPRTYTVRKRHNGSTSNRDLSRKRIKLSIDDDNWLWDTSNEEISDLKGDMSTDLENSLEDSDDGFIAYSSESEDLANSEEYEDFEDIENSENFEEIDVETSETDDQTDEKEEDEEDEEEEEKQDGYHLQIDHREGMVHRQGEELWQTRGMAYVILQMSIGDYALMYGDKPIAIFERKTWKDLSATICDKRRDNVQKLEYAAAQTGCRLFYILEGKQPRANARVGAIKMSSMLAHLNRLMVNYGIICMYTKNSDDTALRLSEMYVDVEALIKRDASFLDKFTNGADDTEESTMGGDESRHATQSFVTVKTFKNPNAFKTHQTRQTRQTDKDIKNPRNSAKSETPITQMKFQRTAETQLVDAWAALPGVGKIIGAKLAKKMTLAEFVRSGVVLEFESYTSKASKASKTGRTSKTTKKPKTIKPTKTNVEKVMSSIPGVGKIIAESLCTTAGINACLTKNIAKLAEMYTEGGRAIGTARAQRICKFLHSKIA